MLRALILGASLLAISSAQAQDFDTAEEYAAQQLAELRERCPDLTLEEARAVADDTPYDPSQAFYPEARNYARAYCVSVEEGARRMQWQEEYSVGEKGEAIQAAVARLQREAPHFSDVRIRHVPDWAYTFTFSETGSEDGAVTLARVLEGTILETDPRIAAETVAARPSGDLQTEGFRFVEELAALGVVYSSGGMDFETGRFEVRLITDTTEEVDARVASGQITVPDGVVILPAPPLPHDAPNPKIAPERLKAFPRFTQRTDLFARPAIGLPSVPARLELIDGCLTVTTQPEPLRWSVDPSGGKSQTFTAIWHATDAPDLTDPNRVGVFDRRSATTVWADRDVWLSGFPYWRSGQVLQQGLGTTPESLADLRDTAVDIEKGCGGPFLPVEGVNDREEAEIRARASRVDQYILNRKVDRAEAERRVAEDEALLARLRDLDDTLWADHKDSVAGFLVSDAIQPLPEDVGYTPKPAQLYVKAGTAVGDLVPASLEPYIQVQEVPRSYAELMAIAEPVRDLLGDSVDVRLNPYEGSLSVHASEDVGPLADALRDGRLQASDSLLIHMEQVGPEAPEPGAYAKLNRDVRSWDGYDDVAALVREFLHEERGGRVDGPDVDRHAVDLLTHGFSDADALRAAEAAGRGALTAHTLFSQGKGESLDWQVRGLLKAERAVVAELLELDADAREGDGYRSTLTFKVADVLRDVDGQVRAGDTLTVRALGGTTPDGRRVVGQNEPPLFDGLEGALRVGETYLLPLSDAKYRANAIQHSGRDTGPAHHVWLDAPVRVDGGRLVQGYGITDVEGLKTALRRP